MLVPVYGFENNYLVNENGEIISNKGDKKIEPAKHASVKQDRIRLKDKKYYDVKYLVYKSFHPDEDIQINDERIIFKDGNCRNNKLDNLILISTDSREEIALALSERYEKKIKPMPSFKNYYISEDGDMYSYYNSPRLLKKQIGTDGYYQVKIPDNFGAEVHIKIHRAVAENFVENKEPEEYKIVHHKDENKLNNNYKNLEWTTLTQNTVYSIGKKCCMLDENYSILSIHDSIADLARYYRVDSSTASKQCRGVKKQFTGGLKARYFDEKNHNFISTTFD